MKVTSENGSKCVGSVVWSLLKMAESCLVSPQVWRGEIQG